MSSSIWLVETKTKSQVDIPKISRQLKLDLQTMLYLVALDHTAPIDLGIAGRSRDVAKDIEEYRPRGVYYNVVRRSAHKSAASMVTKIQEDIESNRGSEWFARWQTPVSTADIDFFRSHCLDPILEELCDDYEWWKDCMTCSEKDKREYGLWNMDARRKIYPDHCPRHFVRPFYRNILDEGGSTDLDNHILSGGSKVGLVELTNLFPELQSV